jgi:hypothetical protein
MEIMMVNVLGVLSELPSSARKLDTFNFSQLATLNLIKIMTKITQECESTQMMSKNDENYK